MEKKQRPWGKVLLWAASVVLMTAAFLGAMIFLPENNVAELVEYLIITALILGFLFLISGKKTFGFWNNQTGCTVKALLPMLVFSLIFTAAGCLSLLMERPPLAENWFLKLLLSAANMLLVQLVVTGLCFLAVCKKVGKTIDYKKILEDW